MIKKIISGGRIGADQAALDVAIKMGIPHNEDDAIFVIMEALWKKLRQTHKLRVVK